MFSQFLNFSNFLAYFASSDLFVSLVSLKSLRNAFHVISLKAMCNTRSVDFDHATSVISKHYGNCFFGFKQKPFQLTLGFLTFFYCFSNYGPILHFSLSTLFLRGLRMSQRKRQKFATSNIWKKEICLKISLTYYTSKKSESNALTISENNDKDFLSCNQPMMCR